MHNFMDGDEPIPTPYSLLPTPYSLRPTPYSLLPLTQDESTSPN
ncbi:hypothetical protein [Moorena sp. SIO4G3]|nr:hypothetical protein [Moorena sp. SIO4G3]